MLDPLSGLTRWERWALEAWLDSLGGREPSQIKWSELPPAQYARALGELAARKGLRLPRRYVRAREHNPAKGSIGRSRSIRATKPWEGR